MKDNNIINGLEILKTFPFTSELKRQSVVAQFGGKLHIFAMKGAPETVCRFLKTKPDTYDDYLKYAASGYRVIALAYKILPKERTRNIQAFYENNMIFGGFVLFGSSLKEHAAEMCRELVDSNHKVLMITGDNLLTAQNVAEQLGLDTDGAEGPEIDHLLCDDNTVKNFFDVRIFARADPKHKEQIIKKYKQAGFYTMMVGDGTNDVGALKASDVGVAMLDCKTNTDSNSKEHSIKPGDASMAAPFTIKSNSLKSIIEIIQQGRSSLVTTIQMYKILALNSITNAFFLSLVDILGVKFSEYQMLSLGILAAMAFQAISSGKALSCISKQRPLTTIFNRYILLSITGQSIVHICTFLAIYRFIPRPAVATKFEPSIMNTVLYVVSSTQAISTFMCNYIGRPFREGLTENKLMMFSLIGLLAFCVNVFLGLHAGMNEMLEVVNLTDHVGLVLFLVVVDSFLSLAIEKVCFQLFMLE